MGKATGTPGAGFPPFPPAFAPDATGWPTRETGGGTKPPPRHPLPAEQRPGRSPADPPPGGGRCSPGTRRRRPAAGATVPFEPYGSYLPHPQRCGPEYPDTACRRKTH